MPVVDASVLVEFVARGDRHEAAEEAIAADYDSLFAPHLIDAEVGHAIRGLVARGELEEGAGGAALDELADLRLMRAHHGMLLGAAWELRSTLTFYDALYVALAELLEVELITLDARLARAIEGGPVSVELLN
ncbi:MAG: PIN domain-containing protein [Solirubrobacterales bacterium]|nr:PIN domain-containing protein [Solirubrobacterales bacterium]